MRDRHRSNSVARQHFTIERKLFVDLTPNLLYTGTLSKTQDWQDTAHSHRFLEIILVLEGTGTIVVDESQYSVGPGDLIIYNAGAMHYEHSSAQTPIAASFVAFDKIRLKNLPENCILPAQAPCIFGVGKEQKTLARLFDMINSEISAKEDFSAEIAQNAAYILLMYVFRILHHNQSAVELLHKDSVLQKILDYIDENYLHPIGLSEISAECFVNKYYLSHLFAEQLGMTVGQYIRSKRVDLAKSLLVQTDLSISEISERCGFNDINYFVRLFKKSASLTPLQYRKSLCG